MTRQQGTARRTTSRKTGTPTGDAARNSPAAARGEVDQAVVRTLFNSFEPDTDETISTGEIRALLRRSGLLDDDPRIQHVLAQLATPGTSAASLTYNDFATVMHQHGSGLLRRAMEGRLVVPDFEALTSDFTRFYEAIRHIDAGQVADYIPQLKRVPADRLAISVCTVDGQRFSLGDSTSFFCLQSVSKPISYCLALEEHGPEDVHRHVGREPSGQSFNQLALNPHGLPHNPMVNAGAIMSTSLIRPDLDIADRFDHVAETWRRLSGSSRVGFNNAVYLSERQTADRNFALGYSMRESGAFRLGVDLQETLEFYFQNCAIELDAEMLGVVAASLANAGICPLTDDAVFSPSTVQNCLSLMSSCGMYDFSGEFAFTIGLPAKSGVSGALMVVVPGVMGISVWSPKLDELGNTVRGIEFCRRLVAEYTVHVFDSLVAGRGRSPKKDPRSHQHHTAIEGAVALCWMASQGDLHGVRSLIASGVDPGVADYDGRTALHLAAAEGHADVVRFLLSSVDDPLPVDRWGGTPVADAESGGHQAVITLLRTASPRAGEGAA